MPVEDYFNGNWGGVPIPTARVLEEEYVKNQLEGRRPKPVCRHTLNPCAAVEGCHNEVCLRGE